MDCQCGNKEAYRIRMYSSGECTCDACSSLSATWVPDVYLGKGGQEFNNLTTNGTPVPFFSKQEKAMFMRSRGIEEVGDRVHGAPFSAVQKPVRGNVRSEIREAVQKAKQDLRRKYGR